MIVLNVTYKCRPGMREAFLERIFAEGIDVYSRAEEGNIKYDYYFPADDDDGLFLVERWRDEAALAAHELTPHFKRLLEFKPAYVLETCVEKYAAE